MQNFLYNCIFRHFTAFPSLKSGLGNIVNVDFTFFFQSHVLIVCWFFKCLYYYLRIFWQILFDVGYCIYFPRTFRFQSFNKRTKNYSNTRHLRKRICFQARTIRSTTFETLPVAQNAQHPHVKCHDRPPNLPKWPTSGR